MSCVYCDPKSRIRIFSAWMSATRDLQEAAQCSGKPHSAASRTKARWNESELGHHTQSGVPTERLARHCVWCPGSGSDPDRLVVERAAAADVGGPRSREEVGVAVLAEVAALRQQRDIAALPRVVA